MGLERGAKFERIDLQGGVRVEHCTVVDIMACAQDDFGLGAEVILTLKEDGLSRRHDVRWNQIVRFVR
jgi:hypothetical protein